MATYLYIWELGAGMGHLARMQQISQGLKDAGHRISWCVPPEQQQNAARFWPEILAAPNNPRPRPTVAEPGSFAELLQNEGWHQADRLMSWIRQWQELFASHDPDRILLDFAPNALLAAIAEQRQVDVLGTGFYTPPNIFPLPAMRQDQGVYADRLLWAEQQLVTVLEKVLKQPVSGLSELLHHQNVTHHLLTYEAWDHYSGRESARYSGLVTGFSGQTVQWPAHFGKRAFAYLKMFPCLPQFLHELVQQGVDTIIHGSPEVAEMVRGLNLENVRFCTHPVDERCVAEAGAVMINHAGHDGTVKAAMTGLALLQLPLNIEQLLSARNAKQLGIGDWLHAQDLNRFSPALQQLFDRQAARQKAAQQWAEGIHSMQTNLAQLIKKLDG